MSAHQKLLNLRAWLEECLEAVNSLLRFMYFHDESSSDESSGYNSVVEVDEENPSTIIDIPDDDTLPDPPVLKRQTAQYKRSSSPWTEKEFPPSPRT